MKKRSQTSRAKSNNSNSDFNVDIPHWSKAMSSEEEEIGILKCRRKNHAEIMNEEVKGSSSEVE